MQAIANQPDGFSATIALVATLLEEANRPADQMTERVP